MTYELIHHEGSDYLRSLTHSPASSPSGNANLDHFRLRMNPDLILKESGQLIDQ